MKLFRTTQLVGYNFRCQRIPVTFDSYIFFPQQSNSVIYLSEDSNRFQKNGIPNSMNDGIQNLHFKSNVLRLVIYELSIVHR